MTAKLATGSTIPRSASDQPQVGGVQFDCGYLSPYFVTDPERMVVAFENAYVLAHEKRISSRMDLLPLLEQITKSGKPLLIIAEDVGEEALAALVVSKLRGPLQVAAVRAPGFGDERKRILQDIALLTRGKAITENLDIQLKSIQISDLGQARKITIDKNSTVVEGSATCDRLPPLSLRPATTRIHASPFVRRDREAHVFHPSDRQTGSGDVA